MLKMSGPPNGSSTGKDIQVEGRLFVCADVKSLQTSSILERNLCKVKHNLAKAREFAPVQVHWSFPGSMYVSYVFKGRRQQSLFGFPFLRLGWLNPEAPGSTSPSFQPFQ